MSRKLKDFQFEGISDFLDLGDVPSSFTGNAKRSLQVNSAEDALEFMRHYYTASGEPTDTNDNTQGYSEGSIWIKPASDAMGRFAFICSDDTTNDAIWLRITYPQSKYYQTSDPTGDDNYSLGYSNGSIWINDSADKAFICMDPVLGGSSKWRRLDCVVTAKGEILTHDGTHAAALGTGGSTDGQVLTRDSSAAQGIKWESLGGGSWSTIYRDETEFTETGSTLDTKKTFLYVETTDATNVWLKLVANVWVVGSGTVTVRLKVQDSSLTDFTDDSTTSTDDKNILNFNLNINTLSANEPLTVEIQLSTTGGTAHLKYTEVRHI